MPTPAQIVNWLAAANLAQLQQSGFSPPESGTVVGTARSADDLYVVLTVCRYKPTTIAPTPRERQAIESLTEREKEILALLDATTPRKATWIASRLKVRLSAGRARAILAELERRHFLKHARGEGYTLGPLAK